MEQFAFNYAAHCLQNLNPVLHEKINNKNKKKNGKRKRNNQTKSGMNHEPRTGRFSLALLYLLMWPKKKHTAKWHHPNTTKRHLFFCKLERWRMSKQKPVFYFPCFLSFSYSHNSLISPCFLVSYWVVHTDPTHAHKQITILIVSPLWFVIYVKQESKKAKTLTQHTCSSRKRSYQNGLWYQTE